MRKLHRFRFSRRTYEQSYRGTSGRRRCPRQDEFAAPGTQSNIIADHFDPTNATFEAHNLDPAKVKMSLESFGCAWITNLFDTKALAHFDQTITINIARIEESYRALGLPDGFNVGFPLYFASDPNRDKAQGLFRSMYPNLFDPDQMVGVDTGKLAQYVFQQMRSSGLDVAVKSYLKMDPLYTSAAICHIRSFIPSGVDWFGEFHQDNRLYNSDAEILTLWFPFRYQHGPMPSLEFLPLKSKSHLPCSSVCGIDNEMFEPGAFWRPAYQLGDAMLLSGFVPHRTYVEIVNDFGADEHRFSFICVTCSKAHLQLQPIYFCRQGIANETLQ